ncbi:MAG: alpha/beta hydrolase [Steroidobacteraceae bacterium]
MKLLLGTIMACLFMGSLVASAQNKTPVAWKDPSPHKVRFVTVDQDVQLEVLDWGGKGQPVVLLAGLSNTAHVFDEFALKLAKTYRVYGITRRGYGASSAPLDGYDADRMGDDVLAVLDALKIRKPVLIGHSFGGSDISSVASRHPERIAGGIYLDCDEYAYSINRDELLYENPQWRRHLNELQQKLAELSKEPRNSRALAQELLQGAWPQLQKDLETMAAPPSSPPKSSAVPSAADLQDWPTALAWYRRTYGADNKLQVPESEWRQILATTADGRPMFSYRVDPRIETAINQGMHRYNNIPVPALLMLRSVAPLEASADSVAEGRWQNYRARAQGRADAFLRAAPNGRVVLLPGANHYVYLSNEEEVLSEIHAFTASLAK